MPPVIDGIRWFSNSYCWWSVGYFRHYCYTSSVGWGGGDDGGPSELPPELLPVRYRANPTQYNVTLPSCFMAAKFGDNAVASPAPVWGMSVDMAFGAGPHAYHARYFSPGCLASNRRFWSGVMFCLTNSLFTECKPRPARPRLVSDPVNNHWTNPRYHVVASYRCYRYR